MGGLALAGRVLAAVLSLAVLVGSGYYWATFREFTANVPRVSAIDSGAKPSKDIDGKDQNILIVGNDDRETATDKELAELGTTRDGGSLNTDTMMLLHVPADGKEASAISFPRDTWVSIPGHGQDRLNSAYPYGTQDAKGDRSGGARLLVQTLQTFTGLTVDHYVSVDLLGFYRISNAIGGVTVCLNAAQNAQTELADGDGEAGPEGYSGINLKKGKNVIKGKQALAFVRQRHGLPRGDLDRIVRQQYFLSAVFRKIASAGTLLNPLKLQKLLSAVSSSLTMDGDTKGHDGLRPLELARQIQDLSAGALTFATIPTSSDMVDGKSVQTVNPDALQAFIARAIGTTSTSAYSKAKAVAPSTVSVAVLNGTGAGGLAGSNASVLNTVGFKTTLGDADSSAATEIRYPPGMESGAKTLARYVPGATVVRTTNVSVVTLVLGGDGKKAVSVPVTKAPAPGTPAPTPTVADQRNAAQTDCIN